MEPTLIARPATILVGAVSHGGSICELWQAFDACADQIKHRIPGMYYEVHTHADDPESAPEYFVSVAVAAAEGIPDGLTVKRLPAGQYAVFTHRLADGGFTGCNAAMNDWLARGPYRLTANVCIQVFDDRFQGVDHPDSVIDFLLPVQAT